MIGKVQWCKYGIDYFDYNITVTFLKFNFLSIFTILLNLRVALNKISEQPFPSQVHHYALAPYIFNFTV